MSTRRPPPPAPPPGPPPLPPRRRARHGSDENGSSYQARARADRQRSTRKRLWVVGLPLAVLITGIVLFAVNRDPDAPYAAARENRARALNARTAAFPEGWNVSEFRAIEPLIAGTERDKIKRLLRKVVRRRGWEAAFPKASAPRSPSTTRPTGTPTTPSKATGRCAPVGCGRTTTGGSCG